MKDSKDIIDIMYRIDIINITDITNIINLMNITYIIDMKMWHSNVDLRHSNF